MLCRLLFSYASWAFPAAAATGLGLRFARSAPRALAATGLLRVLWASHVDAGDVTLALVSVGGRRLQSLAEAAMQMRHQLTPCLLPSHDGTHAQ